MIVQDAKTRRRVRRTAAGWLLAGCIGLAVVSVFFGLDTFAAGSAAWLAGVALWPDTGAWVRRQALAFIGIGLAGMGWAAFAGAELAWGMALSGNALLIAMLAAVSFLALIANPGGADSGHAPSGRRSIFTTGFGLHVFGAVVNLSALVIMANRMAVDGKLDSRQVRLLSRCYGAAGFWSPFFGSMAAALTFAPGAELGALIGVGVPLALLALVVTATEVSRESPDTFRGFPMHVRSLWLPALLAVMILVIHDLAPSVSILGIIALLAPTVTLAVLALRRARPLVTGGRHATDGLPLMRNELLLFLAAGFMAAGLTGVFDSFGGWVPFAHFGGPQATALLVVMVLLAVLGVHPVATIAAFGTLLVPIAPDPNLLAMTFLAAWAIGVVVGPWSGINLTLQGAYGVRPRDLLRWNAGYSALLLVAATVALNA